MVGSLCSKEVLGTTGLLFDNVEFKVLYDQLSTLRVVVLFYSILEDYKI